MNTADARDTSRGRGSGSSFVNDNKTDRSLLETSENWVAPENIKVAYNDFLNEREFRFERNSPQAPSKLNIPFKKHMAL